MFGFLSQIVDSITTAVQFVVMNVQSFVNWIVLIPRYSTYVQALFAWLPQPFATFAVAGLGLSLMLFVFGRI